MMMQFRSAWWLPGPHAATLWGKFGRKEPELDVRWERLDTPDGDFVELAHLNTDGAASALTTRARNECADDTTPRLVILHGLEGGVKSHYVRGLMREAQSRGWNATLMLFRTCGPTPNTLPRSYHSGDTGDALLVIERLASQFPNAPIGAVGISLGGNVLSKLLGEQGDNLPSQLVAAVAVSSPFDLARASRHIGQGFSRIYQKAFLRSLLPKATAKIGRHPELASVKSALAVRTIWQFDDEFTSPVHGFANAADYYARSSALQFLPGIRRPTLLLNAVDDPFMPRSVLDDARKVAASNPAITIEFLKNGGHVGFVAGSSPWRPFYYGEWRAAEFLAEHFRVSRIDTEEDDADETHSLAGNSLQETGR
jgi:uncharacterized protein